MSVEPTTQRMLGVAGNYLDTAIWGHDTPSIFMLHEGLGSIAGWKGVPAAVAAATGETVLAYDRAGHGQSTPVPTQAWPTRWLYDEAAVLAELVGQVGATAPLVVGHSDGGSIALIAAAQSLFSPRAILTLAAHSWVEQICFDSIVEIRNARELFVHRLGRTHAAPAAVFEAWSGVWVSQAFRTWDLRPALHTIVCPVLVAQGGADEYASPAHAELTAQAIGTNATSQLLPGLGHMLHHQDEQTVVDVIVEFARTHRRAGDQPND